MSQPIVFVSYSQKDEKEKDELLSHLAILQSAGLFDLWSDDRIRGGSDWEQEINQAMARASVAILLISANYLSTEFILDKQIPVLLRRREREGLIVFPVIAKACAWEKIDWLAKMRVRPKNGQPVWRGGGLHADEELVAIAREIAEIIVEEEKDETDVTPTLPRPVTKSQYYPCFISYSHKDEEFAHKLYADLQQHGVRCWYAPEDIKIGDKIRPTIEQSIQAHEKLLLVLSENSINSAWVEKEVETAFEKEQKHNQLVLFPIGLDDAVMETDQAWAADIRRMRLIGDFSQWKNPDNYQKALKRLLRDLKVN